MAVVIVLEDGWDGHYEISSTCHQAGHRVHALEHPGLLLATLRASSADVLVVDANLPGVSLASIRAIAGDFGLPVVATGYPPRPAAQGLSAYVPKPSSPAALLGAVESAVVHGTACAA